MSTKKNLLMMVFLSAVFMTGSAQSVVFKLNNNADSVFSISSVQRLTYTGTGSNVNLVVTRRSGTPTTFPISNIRNFRFTGVTSSVSNFNAVTATEFRIYPNPFRGLVNISYHLSSTETVSVEILDMAGRSIKSWPAEKKKPGKHNLVWQAGDSNGRSIQPGTYICRIKTAKGSVSKMMIME